MLVLVLVGGGVFLLGLGGDGGFFGVLGWRGVVDFGSFFGEICCCFRCERRTD